VFSYPLCFHYLTNARSFESFNDIISSICYKYFFFIVSNIRYIYDDLVTITIKSYAKFSEPPVNNYLKILFCEILSLHIILGTSYRCLSSRFGIMFNALYNFSYLNLAFSMEHIHISLPLLIKNFLKKLKISFRRGIRSFIPTLIRLNHYISLYTLMEKF
jgi:hypothetical protein